MRRGGTARHIRITRLHQKNDPAVPGDPAAQGDQAPRAGDTNVDQVISRQTIPGQNALPDWGRSDTGDTGNISARVSGKDDVRACPRCQAILQAVTDGNGPGRYDCRGCGVRFDYGRTAAGLSDEPGSKSPGPTSDEAGTGPLDGRSE